MPVSKLSRRKERQFVFLIMLMPVIVAGIVCAVFFAIKQWLIPAAITGIVVGGAVAFLLSSVLLDSMLKTNQRLRLKLQENFTEAAAEKIKLETILKHINDGILAIDLRGRIIHANDACRIMLRMSEDDVTMKSYDDIILRFTDDLTLKNILSEYDKSRASSSFSYGGQDYEVRFDMFTDTVGNRAGIIIIFRDVTERKKIDNMQVDFLANVSHELKTPLTSIKGYAETLLAGAAEDKGMTLEFLGIINSETDRMTRLVKELLQLSRLDTKQQKWNKQDTDIVALVRMAAKKMGMLAINKKQQLNFFGGNKDSDALILNIDRDRIEQVIINIISNAIKYTKEGGRVDVDIIRGKGWVHILIADNGIGIPDKELSRVFERFFMVDKSRGGQARGTGLGLSISKQIIEEHGGAINLESEYGHGTKVTISLPTPKYRGRSNIL